LSTSPGRTALTIADVIDATEMTEIILALGDD
jgi:hypothetical protein